MAKKENEATSNESNLESDSPYIQDVASENKASWLSSRAAKITAIAVGSSLALGAAFAGGAAAGQLTGGARGGEFGMGQSGPQFDGGPQLGEKHENGPDGKRPPHNDGDERGEREDHDGPKSFGPPIDMPAPSSTTAP